MKFIPLLFFAVFAVKAQEIHNDENLITSLESAVYDSLLNNWYPLAVDTDDGGYYSNITHDFQLGKDQNKMIVTQSRHLWVTSKAAVRYADEQPFISFATQGFEFLRDYMWDKDHGGFHTLVSKKGIPIKEQYREKTAYGNAFAIYGLAAYYKASGNVDALDLAKKTFYWLEKHGHDSINNGYYQNLALNGTPIKRHSQIKSVSTVGFKDQNSTIHLLEAFTELYDIWPDDLLKTRLEELFLLIRDTIINKDNYMNLFFTNDWKPISFKGQSHKYIKKHYYIDHISFGHDIETAYLLLEASRALNRGDENYTLLRGKATVDHALKGGWDDELGGFYDGGYYYKGDTDLTIVNIDKNWWAQAEAMNTLLIMQSYFPNSVFNYRLYFDKLWFYVQTFIMDKEYGGWYEWGIDNRQELKTAWKGRHWKGTYHNYRALTNCIDSLKENK